MQRWILTAAAALLTAALTACLHGDGPDLVHHVRGFAIADDPLVGASVTITSADGSALPHVAQSTTNDQGAFIVRAAALPPSYLVVASGGTYRGQPFKGSLITTLENFDAQRRIAYATPATTLVAAHMRRGPAPGLDQAEAAVRNFLGLPQHNRIHVLKRNRPYVFSARAFMAEAIAAVGGFDAHVAVLAGEVGTGGRRTYQALPGQVFEEAAETSLATTILSFVGKNLLGGAIGAGGSMALSKVLSAAGVGSDLSEVQAQLDTMNSELTLLSNQIQLLGTELSCVENKFTVDSNAQSMLDTIGNVTQMLDHFSKMSATDPGYANEQQSIKTSIAANLTVHTDAFYFIAGNPNLQSKGAIRGFGSMLTTCGYFFNADKSQAVANQYLYLSTAMGAACTQIVNYLGAQNQTADQSTASTLCNDPSSGYLTVVGGLAAPNSIPTGSNYVIDTRTKFMWWFGGLKAAPTGGTQYLYQLLQDVQAQSGGKSWSAPALGNVGQFITPCYAAAAGLRSCLLAQGWGSSTTVGGVTTSTDFYGPGDIYFYYDSSGNGLDGAIASNGTHAAPVCSGCFAGLMLLRSLDAGEIYWRD